MKERTKIRERGHGLETLESECSFPRSELLRDRQDTLHESIPHPQLVILLHLRETGDVKSFPDQVQGLQEMKLESSTWGEGGGLPASTVVLRRSLDLRCLLQDRFQIVQDMDIQTTQEEFRMCIGGDVTVAESCRAADRDRLWILGGTTETEEAFALDFLVRLPEESCDLREDDVQMHVPGEPESLSTALDLLVVPVQEPSRRADGGEERREEEKSKRISWGMEKQKDGWMDGRGGIEGMDR